MLTTSAPAPTPSTGHFAFIANTPRRPRRKPGTVHEPEREAAAAVLSIIRNVRYDIERARSGEAAPVSPEYLIRAGLQLLEIADEFRSILPRDWDVIIDRVSAMAVTRK